MSLTPLGPGAEFDVIRRILKDAASSAPPVAVGPGDDCALIESTGDRCLAVSVDLTVEGVHFQRSWGSEDQVGGRAVRVALSDLAAMAAEPLAVLVAVSVPDAQAARVAEAVGLGCRRAAEEFGVPLVGGDLTRGAAEVGVYVAALGWVAQPLLRSGARPGDELWVTGELGAAGAAVRAWTSASAPDEAWCDRFWRPQPRLAAARWLRDNGAVAAIDLSDGLLADAGHIAAASGVALEIDFRALPVGPGVEAELALSGGEDYELLVTFPRGILGKDSVSAFRETFGIPLTRVGRAAVGTGVRVCCDGEELQLASGGFDHFD